MSIANSEVKFEVSRDIIDAHVRAAIAQALNKNPEALVKSVIDAVFAQKPERSYHHSDPTIFQQQVSEMIRKEALGAFNEWLEEQKPKIKAEVKKRLEANNGKLIKDIVDKLQTQLAYGFKIEIQGLGSER